MGDHLEIRIEQGFQLNPTPEKLIKGYLIPWVTGQNPIWNGVVEKAIYGDSFPWEIFSDIESLYHSKMEEKGAIKYTIFAFTTLVRARNSKRVSRKAGKGTWDGQTGPMKIEDSNTGFIIGQSKMLTFGNSGKADVGHWIMHEYSLSKELVKKSGRANAADLVVCKITKTVKKDKSDHNTNQGFFNGDYQVQCAQPESYDDGSNYERFAPATSESPAGIGHRDRYDAPAAQPEPNVDGSNHMRLAPDTTESPAAIGYNDRNDAMAAQPESNGESCNLVRFAPETNERFFNGDYQVQCAQPESYGDGSNYERFAPATSEGFSSEYIGNNGDYQVQAAQPESYDDGSNYARFAPDGNEGFSSEYIGNNDDYQFQAAQSQSYDDGSNYARFVPDIYEEFSSEYIGNNGDQVHAVQPESYDDGSYYARFTPDTNEFLLPANEVPFANPGFDPFAQPNIVPTVQQSDERHAPLQPSEDATVSMKRAAEVEDSDMKRQKCDGKEYSDANPDWMTEFEDLFPSDFHQLMEAETMPNPEGSGDGWVPQPMITHGANAFDVSVPTEEQQRI
ncbi:uncharacterized protein LOC121771176 isoform X1 [Salvia splendens]|uniref:uncharacterized protein LOC121771176 isoform X1 n=1 Tax=Salvia splendens TaxID=180675 RepID=UPI001C26F3E1|nr:uncharacterized protein LOC121771176 isoform X1 [Salvia splendens]